MPDPVYRAKCYGSMYRVSQLVRRFAAGADVHRISVLDGIVRRDLRISRRDIEWRPMAKAKSKSGLKRAPAKRRPRKAKPGTRGLTPAESRLESLSGAA